MKTAPGVNQWTPPSIALSQVQFIGLAPVSWGDGFLRDVSLLVLHTTCGKIGMGSAYTSTEKLRAAWHDYKPLINWAALNPAQTQPWVETAARLPENQGFDGKGPDVIPALSAINIALWDLLGHCLNQPIAQLIGGQQWPSLPAYASLEVDYELEGPTDNLTTQLTQAMAKGFRAIKLYLPRFGYRDERLSPAQWLALEEAYLTQARAIVGDNTQLMLDTFGSALDWPDDAQWAEQIFTCLARNNYVWFEEPLSPTNTLGHKRLRAVAESNIASTYNSNTKNSDVARPKADTEQGNTLKLSGGEFFTDPAQFDHWINENLVDILQPDCTIAGGLSTLLSVRSAATPRNMDVIPHGWSTAVGLAADVQFLAAGDRDRLCIVEFMPGPQVTDILSQNPFQLNQQGHLPVPTGPGLGITLDWAGVRHTKFPFTHLVEEPA